MAVSPSPFAPAAANPRAWGRRWLLLGVALALVLSVAGPTASRSAAQPSTAASPEQALVAVSVATVWTAPGAPRKVDARAVAAPADPAGWLRTLGTAGRRGLHGRVETQVLFGQRVLVLERSGSWARVAVPGQPSPKSASGYPGWIPLAQLSVEPGSATAPQATTTTTQAVVTKPTAWAFADERRRVRAIRLSYGTRLPVVARSSKAVTVQGPGGQTLWVAAKNVSVTSPDGAARAATRRAVVAEARRFLGLSYLWGGTSGFGFDCSGLTQLVYAQLGVTIPRDATPQFGVGKRVSRVADLRRGDLVFFRDRTGSIHHVGIYAGNGRMIHSPRTGRPVAYASIKAGVWAREFAGGRRLL